MLRVLFKQGSFWTITNEKTFRDLGYRILWDNWKQTGNERDKTRKVKV